jgi:hypothetical protein
VAERRYPDGARIARSRLPPSPDGADACPARPDPRPASDLCALRAPLRARPVGRRGLLLQSLTGVWDRLNAEGRPLRRKAAFHRVSGVSLASDPGRMVGRAAKASPRPQVRPLCSQQHREPTDFC